MDTTGTQTSTTEQDSLDIAWIEARQHFDQEHASLPVWPAADYETYLNLHTAA
jgi:hypothetical protein